MMIMLRCLHTKYGELKTNEPGDETSQRLVESGTSAKLVDTSVRLVGDDFCMAARQKQIQTGCELSVWKSSVCERVDRLVIKHFPYLPRQGSLPIRFSWLVKLLKAITQSSFDGAAMSDGMFNVFDELPQEKSEF